MATVASRADRARKDKPTTTTSAEPTNRSSEEEIRLLAYRLYERRRESGIAGDADGDWIQAEQLLLKTAPVASAKGA
jgi:hypothetical protein